MRAQMGWLVWKVNGVSLEGTSFKGAMDHIAKVERPLDVLFKTPLLEGDAAKEAAGAAAASPSVAVNETKRRLYEHDAASAGGLRVAEVVTSSRNLMSVNTPTKDLKMQEAVLRAEISKTHSTASQPAPAPAPAPPQAPALAAAPALVSAPGLNLGAPPAKVRTDAVDVATVAAADKAEKASNPVDSNAAAAGSTNPFATGTVAIAKSPKVAVVEQKKRLYAYDTKSGGVTCASVATECRNLLAGGLTPLKVDVACADGSSSSPAPETNYDSGIGPYDMVVWRKTATGKTQMSVSAKSATGDLATIADLKHALLRQTLAAHQGLLKAPLRIVEVWRSDLIVDLGDELQLKAVFERQENGKATLMVENAVAAKPTVTVAAAAPTIEAVTGGGQAQTDVAASKTVHPPQVAARTASNNAGPDLFTFDSPAPAGAPRTAAAAQALAAQLFASPAVAPSARQTDSADIKAEAPTTASNLVDSTTVVTGPTNPFVAGKVAAVPSETVHPPQVAARTASNKAGPDLFTFDSPAPTGAPRTAAAAQALAAQLFASPAVAPSARQTDSADRSAHDMGPCQTTGDSDWVSFDTPVK